MQSGCWCIQSNTNKFHSRNNFYYISGTVRIFQLCYRFILSFVILIAFFIMNTITFYLCLSPSFFSLFHFFYFFHRTDIPTVFCLVCFNVAHISITLIPTFFHLYFLWCVFRLDTASPKRTISLWICLDVCVTFRRVVVQILN